MGERLTPVEPNTGDAHDREFDGNHIAFLARRIVAGGVVHRHYLAVGEDAGVEVGRLLGVIVVPEADRVLGSHGIAP
ncbi:hypothetical protein D3C79_973340 [compost metagenome]